MKLCICDDEKNFIIHFKTLLDRYCDETKNMFDFISFTSGNQLLSYCTQKNDIDILFLDIRLQTSNGIELAEKIRNYNRQILIIFITSFPQYALCGYKVKAFDFLIKPLLYPQLKKVLTSCLSELRIKSKEFLIIKNSSGIYKLNFSEIMYLETYNRNILFHLNHGTQIIGHKKMKEYEKLLNHQFYRCHSGYIVNMHYITSLQKDSVTIDSKIDIPISRYKKKDFENSYTIFLCNLL